MNIVKILLILGLGYVALNQKVEKTRNMLLVVTGLLAFCMFSMEGFTDITFTGGAGLSSDDATSRLAAGGTITAGGATYTFPANFLADSSSPTWTCPSGKTPGPEVAGARATLTAPLTADNIKTVFPCVDKQKCKDAASSFTCSPGTKKSGDSDYCAGSACASVDFGATPTNCCAAAGAAAAPNETCGAGKTNLPAECPDDYTDKANASCAAATCVAADFTSSGACCELPCSDDDCSIFHSGENTKCGTFLFFDQNCK